MTKTTFVDCNLFVGTEDNVKENAWFTVDDVTGKITEVGQGAAKAADKTVDLDGQYVMSGLINAHTHIGMDKGLIQKPKPARPWQLWRICAQACKAG